MANLCVRPMMFFPIQGIILDICPFDIQFILSDNLIMK